MQSQSLVFSSLCLRFSCSRISFLVFRLHKAVSFFLILSLSVPVPTSKRLPAGNAVNPAAALPVRNIVLLQNHLLARADMLRHTLHHTGKAPVQRKLQSYLLKHPLNRLGSCPDCQSDSGLPLFPAEHCGRFACTAAVVVPDSRAISPGCGVRIQFGFCFCMISMQEARAFRPSASIISGHSTRFTTFRSNSCVAAVLPKPQPISTAEACFNAGCKTAA